MIWKKQVILQIQLHIGNTRPNLTFFQYIQALKPYTGPVPPNAKQ